MRSVRCCVAFLLLSGCVSNQPQRVISDECVTVLAGGLVDELDRDFAVCPDDTGHVSMVADAKPDVNGIPDAEMPDMFLDPPTYASCRDIFADEPFATAMSRIAAAQQLPGAGDATQRAMTFVFHHATWTWHPFIPPPTDGFTIYACTDLGLSASIHLYKSMCTENAIYDTYTGRLNLGSRFYLVATHEIGHVIDDAAGPLPFSNDREKRATVYGAFLAQCHARVWQHLYASMVNSAFAQKDDPADERARRQAVTCLAQKWRAAELELRTMRHPPFSTAQHVDGIAAANACAYNAATGRVAAPALARCPTTPAKETK